MMSVLSDTIEKFIKGLMNEYEGRIELQRNELAQHFNCGTVTDQLCYLQRALRPIKDTLLKAAGAEGDISAWYVYASTRVIIL